MSNLESKLEVLNPQLYAAFLETKTVVSKLLQMYIKNFPTYTDHSIEHTQEVLNIAGDLLTTKEIETLNADEVYVLCMACILHDVGMCIPEDKIQEISETEDLIERRKTNPDALLEDYIREIHHILSLKFINQEWQNLKIPSEMYATAIGLVAQGHRKVDLNDFDVYNPRFFVKSGREFVCLPYLSCILRIADELDISNLRTPDILFKYYIPDNKTSRKEWEKHKATIQVNYENNKVIIRAKCTDQNMLAALEEQFEKVRSVINQCQKTIRSLHMVGDRGFGLNLMILEPKYEYLNFDPKGIKYSFEVKNVINAFIGEDLYENKDAAIREAVQNAIDACNYKLSVKKEDYQPKIVINVEQDLISIEDNGQGMDEFIIENYFGKLASSFYEQENIKNDFQAIGQFGIGVFSYFLISDYIDVETKRADKDALKFRTDKDPNGYFHFFDNFKRQKEGTKIILHLKEKNKGIYNLDKISKYIKKTFPFIDIPIYINNGKENVQVELSNMVMDFKLDVLPYVYYRSHKITDKLELLTVNIEESGFSGILGLVVPKSIDKCNFEFQEVFDYSLFENHNYGRGEFSNISFSQKGVYINDYGGRLRYVFGKVNLHDKLKVNLSRTGFINDKALLPVLEKLEAKLINQVFDKIYSLTGKYTLNHKKFTDWFLGTYWVGYSNFKGALNKTVMTNFCFEIRLKGVVKYLSLAEIKKDVKKFVVFSNDTEVDKYEKLIDLPIAIIKPSNVWSYRVIFERNLKYGQHVKRIDSVDFIVFDEKLYETEHDVRITLSGLDVYQKFTTMDCDLIGLNYWRSRKISKKEEQYCWREGGRINIKHPIISRLSKLVKEDVLNSTELRLSKELMEIIANFLYGRKRKSSEIEEVISKLNTIVEKIIEQGNIEFETFKLEDLRE
ncbi:HD domain-containing protein [Maribacter dokdonensis]|uniref:HD domain-containing protein n=1 Tax=Maribacter dokdonensis TaxID=320912 RepID=UPI003297A8C9